MCFELGEFQVLNNSFFVGKEGVVCKGSRSSGRGVCEQCSSDITLVIPSLTGNIVLAASIAPL